MTATRLSPTANLLRNSRLFSLPPPLPRPSHDVSTSARTTSDTATLPYPTHAAIETPQSSLSRGDWGLKRPLPLRATTETSTPTVRVDAVDTWEHITNFESAADHVLTLRKWQELNLPVSVSGSGRAKTTQQLSFSNGVKYELHKSVFERHRDNTVSDEQSQLQRFQRWKFNGPWLAGKSEGEFKEYLQKEIRRRKPEFQDFLRKRCSEEKLQQLKQVATDRGEDLDQFKESPQVTEEEYVNYVKRLRHNGSTLSTIIHQFLDLPEPPAPAPDTQSFSFSISKDNAKSSSTSTYSETGPPATHPSAGLSYLRTSSYLTNHPKLGPQLKKPPVRGRVLRPAKDILNRSSQPLIGIAGIVAEDLDHRRFANAKDGRERYNGIIAGGAKYWYHPSHASIDAQGRIKLRINAADEDTTAIYGGEVQSEAVDGAITSPSNRAWEGLSTSPGTAKTTSRDRAESLGLPAGRGSVADSFVKLLETGH